MPNIYISHRRIRIELISLAVCFLIATVLMATAFLYAVWTLLRLIAYGIKKLFNRKS